MRRDRESKREGKTSEAILIQCHRTGSSAGIDRCVSKICRLIQQLMPFSVIADSDRRTSQMTFEKVVCRPLA
jgi:hypothetical protein